MGEPTSTRRAVGPFQVPKGNFGLDTNPFATPAMPGFITPEKVDLPEPKEVLDPFTSLPGRQRAGAPRMQSYKKGTPYVPQDGPAMLHEGEAVIPAEENPVNNILSQGGQGFLGRFLSNIGTTLGAAAQAGSFVEGLGKGIGALEQKKQRDLLIQNQLAQQNFENNIRTQQLDLQKQHLDLARQQAKPPKPDFGAQVQERYNEGVKRGLAGDDLARFSLTGQIAPPREPKEPKDISTVTTGEGVFEKTPTGLGKRLGSAPAIVTAAIANERQDKANQNKLAFQRREINARYAPAETVLSKIESAYKDVIAASGTDRIKKARLLEAQVKSGLSTIARASGEKGTLAEGDVQRALGGLSSASLTALGDPQGVEGQKLADLRDKLTKSKQGELAAFSDEEDPHSPPPGAKVRDYTDFK